MFQSVTTAKLLRGAKARIADPKHWVKGVLATGRDGVTEIPVHRTDAVCFCATGALASESARWSANAYYPSLSLLVQQLKPGWGSVPDFNDDPTTTHADVMALYDRAIQAADPDNTTAPSDTE